MLNQGDEFYHSLTKKYTAIFGTIFNNIHISRSDGTNVASQNFKVPLGYGPREKYLGRLKEDPGVNKDSAIQLPRMSYELISMNYAGNRMINPIGNFKQNTNTGTISIFNPAPYDLIFQLSIMSKTIEDGLKIIEQILPYFTPSFTVTAELIENMPDSKKDIDIVLNAVSNDDSYEGEFTTRRTLVWVLDFTLKGFYYGKTSTPKIIKFATVNTYTQMEKTAEYNRIQVYPGLTSNGQPTSNSAESIPWQQIEDIDDWGFIINIEDIK